MSCSSHQNDVLISSTDYIIKGQNPLVCGLYVTVSWSGSGVVVKLLCLYLQLTKKIKKDRKGFNSDSVLTIFILISPK